MASKKKMPEERKPETIIVKTMESVMHESMMPYSEHVILERALPRVEDGLKPVQRRILYTMNELGNTPDKPHRKCARIVGDCLGKYHPHGDTSVYDALARMAQPFVMRSELVDGHGNFGSIDGDSPAAMRYTEARMTPQSLELLRDIDKDTVNFHLNFDDSLKEPDLLPGRFPNLLVNGASGIAVGLATNIPPHNFGEACDAAILLMDDPDASTADIMKVMPAPDFPTGGILACDDELTRAYETGRGKLTIRAKVRIEAGQSGRSLIVIDEIPYQINKAAMLEKILRVSEEKKTVFAGIYDIRDESDRTGMRAVVEVRKDADAEKLLNALYRYTDLQTTFGVNMVAIAEGKPKTMGVKEILGYYITHQKNVVTRRTRYELNEAKARAHILEGLIIAVDNLDEVIRLIRSSKTPKEARVKLMEAFSLTEIQAQAILDMRLQRLTNLEILTLRKEYADIQKLISRLEGILKSEKKLIAVIKEELAEIRAKYADARRTQLVPSFDEIRIEAEAPVADEAVVIITEKSFIKRMLPKAYERAAASGETGENASVIYRTMTDAKLLLFTDLGNMFRLPVSGIPECRLKDRGAAPGGLLQGLEKDERIISTFIAEDGKYEGELLFVSAQGQIKRTAYSEYDVKKSKIQASGLKAGDKLLSVNPMPSEPEIMLITEGGMAIRFACNEIPCLGRTASGVRGINLNDGDIVLEAFGTDGEGEIAIITDRGYMKRSLVVDFDPQARGGKGVKCITIQKNGATGSKLAAAMNVKDPYEFEVYQANGTVTTVNTDWLKIDTRAGKGVPVVISVMDDVITSIRKK